MNLHKYTIFLTLLIFCVGSVCATDPDTTVNFDIYGEEIIDGYIDVVDNSVVSEVPNEIINSSLEHTKLNITNENNVTSPIEENIIYSSSIQNQSNDVLLLDNKTEFYGDEILLFRNVIDKTNRNNITKDFTMNFLQGDVELGIYSFTNETPHFSAYKIIKSIGLKALKFVFITKIAPLIEEGAFMKFVKQKEAYCGKYRIRSQGELLRGVLKNAIKFAVYKTVAYAGYPLIAAFRIIEYTNAFINHFDEGTATTKELENYARYRGWYMTNVLNEC